MSCIDHSVLLNLVLISCMHSNADFSVDLCLLQQEKNNSTNTEWCMGFIMGNNWTSFCLLGSTENNIVS